MTVQGSHATGTLSSPKSAGMLSALWLLWAALLALLPVPVIDPWLSQYLRTVDQDIIDIFRVIDDLGDAGTPIIPMALMLIGVLAARYGFRDRVADHTLQFALGLAWTFVFVIAAIALSGLPCAILKFVIGRTRPKLLDQEEVYALEPFTFDADYYSFPSGHANTAMAWFLALGFLMPRGKLVFVAVGAVVGLSRVAHNAHFLSDVIFGAALAIFITTWLRWHFARCGLVFDREGRPLPLYGPDFGAGFRRLFRRDG